jgi:mercuric reductase
MTAEDLAGTWAPYLTMPEALRLAARSFGRDVTKLPCCAACPACRQANQGLLGR